jgi:alkane 1-monooxygenase
MMTAVRNISPALTRHSYWLVVLWPLLLPLAWSMRDLPGMGVLFAWFPLLFMFFGLPLVDLLIGRDLHNPDVASAKTYPDELVPAISGLLYLLVLAWAIWVVGTQTERFSLLALIGWTLSVGDIGGVIGINVAHELIHRRKPWLRALGGVMLSTVCYAGFKIEHPRWHHVHVATPADPSSAPRGRTIYTHIPTAWVKNTIRAFRLSAGIARQRGRVAPWLNHEMSAWYGLSVLMTVAAWLWLGAVAALVFVLQGLAAASLLEVINYVEHYGLRRDQRPDGRYEPPSIMHSWDSDFWLSNVLLLQLPRHSDHHVHPSRPFSSLQQQPEAPKLPLGYSTLANLVWVPWLWRRIMHPLLPPETG